MKKNFLSILALLSGGCVAAFAAEPFISFSKDAAGFPVVSDGRPCTVLVDDAEEKGIQIAVDNLQEDFVRVCGAKPQVVNTPSADGPCLIVGSLESPLISALCKSGKLDKAAIIAWCRSKLANYKVPRHVEFRTELPKSAIGKVLRRALREEEEARAAARARRHAGAAAEEAGGEA